MPFVKPRLRGAITPIAACAAVLLFSAAPAWGATDVYPAGGGAFGSDAEGWQQTEAVCDVSLLSTCTASGEYDASSGNPAGSMTAKTNADLNLLGTFESTVVFESPEFTVADAGAATLHLDREFVPGGLIEIEPVASYAVTLTDVTAATKLLLLEEEIEGASPFTGKDAAATVVAGHSYAISVEAKASSTVALNLLVEGDTDVRFDNVALSVQGAAGGGGAGGGGGGGDGAGGDVGSSGALTSAELLSSVRRSSQETAEIHGSRVFVRVSCPRRVQRACRITSQGMIGKRTRVTRRSTVRVASGRAKLVALRVKPRFRDRVAARKRLLILQKVRVGKVSTTFARSRILIRRG